MGAFDLLKTIFGRKQVKKSTSKSQKVVKKKISKEKLIGVVTHYFGKISVAAIKLKAPLNLGEKIHLKGAHDNFTQIVKSMQINHQPVISAKKGDEIGIKVSGRVRENDKVYRASD